MSKPTPGPWEAILDGDERGQPSGMYRRLVAICEKGERYLAVVAERDVERESWPANAVLLAAAPDLLAACIALDGWFSLDDVVDGKALGELQPLLDAMTAAIAKATRVP